MTPQKRIATIAVMVCMAQILSSHVSEVHGEVTDLRSQTTSSVSEIVDGEVGSTDTSIENFPATQSQLPIESFSGLGNFEGGQEAQFGGRGVATFLDPAASLFANPGELGVEADCFSLDASIAYEVESEVLETRDIVFTPADLRLPPPTTSELADQGASDDSSDDVVVLGSVFVNGGILIWSSDPTRDLSGLQVELAVTVEQIGGSSATAGEGLFDGGVEVNGAANGEIGVTSTGGISTLVDGPVLLLASNLPGIGSVVNQLESVGRVHLIVLLDQAIPYQYKARPSDPFSLELKATCRVRNLPDGTGVAAVFGRPFRSLAATISPVTSPKSADIAQDAMNQTISESSVPGKGTGNVGCGVLGICAPLCLILGLTSLRRR
ncbi:MAG: hypothetical protein GXP29_09620 [Planctomycetes bacterium]|nr:hypothetical protein [Planctomycetota bacterium]